MEAPKPGIYEGIPYELYHEWEALRASSLWGLVNTTPAHWKHAQENPEPETRALVFGSAFHTYMLEPRRFGAAYVAGGPINPKTGREYGTDTEKWRKYEEANGGKIILSSDEMEMLEGMKGRLLNNETAQQIIQASKHEVCIVWEDIETGLLCKARLDCLVEGPNCFADLKSTGKGEAGRFEYSARKWGYYLQGAFYRDGLEAVTGREVYHPIFIVSEKEAPYVEAIYQMDTSTAIEYGRTQYREAIRRWQECQSTQEWPGYPGIQSMIPPKYAEAVTIYD